MIPHRTGPLRALLLTLPVFDRANTPALDDLPNPIVRSILEDSRGRLWAGTDGGGLALADRAKTS